MHEPFFGLWAVAAGLLLVAFLAVGTGQWLCCNFKESLLKFSMLKTIAIKFFLSYFSCSIKKIQKNLIKKIELN